MANFGMVFGIVEDLKKTEKTLRWRVSIAEKNKKTGELDWTNDYCVFINPTEFIVDTIKEGAYLGFTGSYKDNKVGDKIYKNFYVDRIKFMGNPIDKSKMRGKKNDQEDELPW